MTDKEFEAYDNVLVAGKRMQYQYLSTDGIQPYTRNNFLIEVQHFLEAIECNQLANYFDMIIEPDQDE